MSARLRLRRRGQAAVELSLTTIVFVPLALYVLFLDDLLRYKLELAETVFSSAWDYTSVPMEDGAPDFSKANEYTYCDHTSAYNSHDVSKECSESGHHQALAAHECWMTGDGYESNKLKCGVNETDTAVISSDVDFNNGGIASCTAQLGVINYLIPQKILSQFSKEDATRTQHFHGGVDDPHDVGNGLAVEDHYMLERQKFGMLVDPWALNVTDDIMAEMRMGKFYDRMNTFYKVHLSDPKDKAKTFFDQAKNDKLIDDAAKQEPMGDDVETPHLAYHTSPGDEISGHYSSAWSDSRVPDTSSARENAYFGVSENDW